MTQQQIFEMLAEFDLAQVRRVKIALISHVAY
jgi:hypothetical protein